MKKLMIAAAVAAMTAGAFANDEGICGGGTTPVAGPAQRVYLFKATVRLADGKTAMGVDKSICGDTPWAENYRVKALRKIKGVFLDCETCSAIEGESGKKEGDQLALSKAPLYIATSDKKYKAIYEAQSYGVAEEGDAGYKFLLLNYIGGTTFAKSKVAEGLFQVNFIELDKYNELRAYSILCAGFGKRGTSSGLLWSLSGRVTGAVTAATWCGKLTECFEPCTQNDYVEEDGSAATDWLLALSPAYDAVYGTMSLKYSGSKSALKTLDDVLVATFGAGYTVMASATDEDPDPEEPAEVAFPFDYIEFAAE